MDVSFISLKLVLPVIRSLLKPTGQVLCLIKPQFEAGKEKVGKKGVVPGSCLPILRCWRTSCLWPGSLGYGGNDLFPGKGA